MYILYLISPNFCAINDAIGCCYGRMLFDALSLISG